MTKYYTIHNENPQQRLLQSVIQDINNGSIVVLPTDCAYVICSKIGDKAVENRISAIKQHEKDHHLAIIVKDLSHASHLVKIDNWCYRILRKATPGPYTFILEANRDLPKRLLLKRKTIGMRIPNNIILNKLLELYNEPLYSTTLCLPGEEFPIYNINDIPDNFIKMLDVIVDGGECNPNNSTIVSLVNNEINILRHGLGDTEIFFN